MSGKYTPTPICLDDVVLPAEVEALVEYVAKNVHEVWASGRIRDGWSYGPERSDSLKQHPSIIPYEELSESEKEYDRATAIATLKTIYRRGFKIIHTEE